MKQRIAGSSVRTGLKFFGISLSQSSLDQTRDSLPDIAVGSKGAVLLLRSVFFYKELKYIQVFHPLSFICVICGSFRSRPIMLLETKVTYNPTKIPTGETGQSLENTMRVCFTMVPYRHIIRGLSKISSIPLCCS